MVGQKSAFERGERGKWGKGVRDTVDFAVHVSLDGPWCDVLVLWDILNWRVPPEGRQFSTLVSAVSRDRKRRGEVEVE